jgi:hypothetical protein
MRGIKGLIYETSLLDPEEVPTLLVGISIVSLVDRAFGSVV